MRLSTGMWKFEAVIVVPMREKFGFLRQYVEFLNGHILAIFFSCVLIFGMVAIHYTYFWEILRNSNTFTFFQGF